MKIAILSESSADAAAIRILVEGVLNKPTQAVNFRPETRSWPSVIINLPNVLRNLHYQTDAEALVVVADLDGPPVHQVGQSQPCEPELECRLCNLRNTIERTQNQLTPIEGRSPVKIAIGVAAPEIEAWYLCGIDHRCSEAGCLQRGPSKCDRNFKNELKHLVYGTDRPALTLATQCAASARLDLA